ncbi:MAG: hypothetical protein ACKO38_01605, partial [Planctomycetota bacterium]
MKTLANVVTFVTVLVAVAVWRGWNDGWYLMTGLFASGPPLSLLAWWKFRPRPTGQQTIDEFNTATVSSVLEDELATADAALGSPRESLVVGGLRGTLLGLGWSVYLALAFMGMQKLPWWYDRYYDSDRNVLEAKLATLEEAQDFSAAVGALEDRLSRKSSHAWQQELIRRLYRDLVSHAQQLSSGDRLSILARARALAQENSLDGTIAQTLETHDFRERNLAQRIDELTNRQDWEGVIDVLKSELLRDENSVDTAQQLYEAYCAAAANAESLDRQAQFYSRAVELAARYRLHADQAQTALSHIKEIEAARDEQAVNRQRLAQLVGEETDTRLRLLDEMRQVASQQPAPLKRLVELTRIGELAKELSVNLPGLDEQIRELTQTLEEQTKFLDRVDEMRCDGAHEEAIRELSAMVRAGDRASWVRALDHELLGCLEEWCDNARGLAPKELSDRVQRAATVAKECNLDAPSLGLRMKAVRDLLVDREQVRQRIAALKRERELEKLRSYLEILIETEPKAVWVGSYGHDLCRTLLAQSLGIRDLQRRRELLQGGIAAARRHSPDDLNDLEAALATVDAEIQQAQRKLEQDAAAAAEQKRRMSPVVLPPGTKVGVIRVSSDEWPFIVVDLWVEDSDGAPLRGLAHKDFKVTIGGQDAEFFLRPVSVDAATTNCVMLIDVSGSVAPVLPEV